MRRNTITGIYTPEQLAQLLWPVAWSGRVQPSEADDDQRALSALVSEARAAMREAEQHSAVPIGIMIANGVVESVVCDEED